MNFYYIEIAAKACNATVIVNGLRVSFLEAPKGGSLQLPCNTELIAKTNILEVSVAPTSIDPGFLDKITLDGEVTTYPEGSMVSPETRTVLESFSIDPRIQEIKENPLAGNPAELFPFKVTAKFVSDDAPSFDDRLNKTKPIENVEALKDWAIKFKEYLEVRNIDALYDLYEPKLLDYDIAYPNAKEPDNRKWFSDWMSDDIFLQTPFTDFKRDDIEPKKWCDGRIWEITLKGNRPLWSTIGFDGRRSRVKVFVGMVENKIKIVR
jgi:hypothetical protein